MSVSPSLSKLAAIVDEFAVAANLDVIEFAALRAVANGRLDADELSRMRALEHEVAVRHSACLIDALWPENMSSPDARAAERQQAETALAARLISLGDIYARVAADLYQDEALREFLPEAARSEDTARAFEMQKAPHLAALCRK